MEKDRNKIREPYKPEDTPKPPQIIDPDEGREREKPVRDKPAPAQREEKSPKNKKPELLGDRADIEDETTI